MLLHSNELPYMCEVCGKKFRDRSNRRKHVKNVHKYLFVNGDINNPLKPGVTPAAAAAGSSQGGTSTGEPPTKKRKNSKKAAQQLETINETGQEGTDKTQTIIKTPAAPRGKKAKAAAAAASAAAGSAGPTQAKVANTKSVIVSASTATVTGAVTGMDRKIIMSPSPKTPKTHGSGSSITGGSPNSLDYIHPPSHSSLPVTVHLPMAGSQGHFSHGRSIIVKATSSVGSSSNMPSNHHQSPPAMSPELYHHSHSQQQHHSRGMQQNVIVYPKPKVDVLLPDHSQQYPSSASSVISQPMQQQAQYYVNHPPDQQYQQHHHLHHQGYSYLPLTSQQPSPGSLMPPQQHPHQIPSPNPTGFEYVLGSTNHLSSQSQDQRGSDPYGSSGGPGSGSQQGMELPPSIKQEYSHHLYSSHADSLSYEPQHYHWATSSVPLPGMDHHPPSSSSPYQQLVVATPAGSNGSSSSVLVNEGPPGSHQHPPPVSLAQSYHHDSTGGLNPNPNALSPAAAYASTGALQGHEVLDPSGNGGNFFYKDFDFSYL